MDTGLDVTWKGGAGGRSVPFHRDGLDIGKRSPGQIPQIPGFGHPKETLGSTSQHPGMSHGRVENPRTGFHVLCWEKLWNTSRNSAALISWEMVSESDLGAVPTFHNCPTNPRALPAWILEFWDRLEFLGIVTQLQDLA